MFSIFIEFASGTGFGFIILSAIFFMSYFLVTGFKESNPVFVAESNNYFL